MTLLSICRAGWLGALLALGAPAVRAQDAPAVPATPPPPQTPATGEIVLLSGEDAAAVGALAIEGGMVRRVAAGTGEGEGEGKREGKGAGDEIAAAEGTGWVRVEVGEGRRPARLTIPLPEGCAIAECTTLTAALRSLSISKDAKCRWLAVDAKGRAGFQRPFDPPAVDTGWQRLEWPLPKWRWGTGRVGDWTQIRALVLVVPPATTIGIDALSLLRSFYQTENARDRFWVLQAATWGGPPEITRAGPAWIVTDVEGAAANPDLRRLADRLERVDAWLTDVAGPRRQPFTGDVAPPRPRLDAPPLVLVFSAAEAYPALFERLGSAWNVSISPPKAGGYTVQDIAAAAWDPAQGFARPVYLHEGVHALAAARLRLVPGHPGHDWLQEGLANYVQLCFHPGSLAKDVYPREFGRPVGERGGLFVPLADLLPKNVSGRNYAQLANLVAWFLAEQPAQLRAITAATADGASPADAFKAAGTTLEAVEPAWHAWGAKTFTADAYAAIIDGRHPGFTALH